MANRKDSHIIPPNKRNGGFTLIELAVVMLMIGILATIGIMQVLSYREKAYNAMLESDLRSIYIASKQFFTENPNNSEVEESDLETYGYVKSNEDIVLEIKDGLEESLDIRASCPGATPDVYQVDQAGRVSKVGS